MGISIHIEDAGNLTEAERKILRSIAGSSDIVLVNAEAKTEFVLPSVDTAPDVPEVGSAPACDSTGLPWDGRIHSANKTINQDGSWKARKGVAPELKKSVEDELRTPTKPSAEPAPDDGSTPLPAWVTGNNNITAASNEPVPVTYADLIGIVSAALEGGRITHEQIGEATGKVGLTHFPLFEKQPVLIPNFLKLLGL